ncbi:MAG: hypothetical protein QM802_19940 [Agriterribacter sp.]
MASPKTIVIDCDGVLTNGKVRYTVEGTRSKEFHSRDIPAIKRLIAAGFTIWIVSKSSWYGLKHFVKRTGANYVLGVKDKAEWARRVLQGEPFIAVCDDYDDLELCKMADSVLVPADASNLLTDALSRNDWKMLCNNVGGSGVVEAIERVLKSEKCQPL